MNVQNGCIVCVKYAIGREKTEQVTCIDCKSKLNESIKKITDPYQQIYKIPYVRNHVLVTTRVGSLTMWRNPHKYTSSQYNMRAIIANRLLQAIVPGIPVFKLNIYG